MKKIIPMDPNILCKKIETQSKVNDIIIPGQDKKLTTIRRVMVLCKMAEDRGIKVGDIIVTRSPVYLELPAFLTDDEQVPFEKKDQLEIVDISQIIACYRPEEA